MPHLFDVPGWSVPSPLVQNSATSSKKRKRPTNDSSKLLSAELNLEKLVERLKDNTKTSRDSVQNETRRNSLKNTKKAPNVGGRSKEISLPKQLKPAEKAHRGRSVEDVAPRIPKRSKTKHVTIDELLPKKTMPRLGSLLQPEKTDDGLTALQRDMKQSLDGARFRMINENLYKSDSQEAHRMMREDPQVYEEYHTGFRHQVQSWPTNPIQHYIASLEKYPQRTVIADLGCGDAALARALVPKDIIVLSFDLVCDDAFVIEADTCDRIPLPGSGNDSAEMSSGQGHIVDVVVCALSLMNTNWPRCLREAWRILKPDGELKIAEVASRFTDVKEFQSLVNSIGFQTKSKDDSNSHFTLFEFKKIPRKGKSEKEWSKILAKGTILKPCEYKRR